MLLLISTCQAIFWPLWFTHLENSRRQFYDGRNKPATVFLQMGERMDWSVLFPTDTFPHKLSIGSAWIRPNSSLSSLKCSVYGETYGWIQKLNNSALKDNDKLKEKNKGRAGSAQPCSLLLLLQLPCPIGVLWHPREAIGRHLNGKHNVSKHTGSSWEQKTPSEHRNIFPHPTNQSWKWEKPSPFFRLVRALRRKRCLSSLPCVAENFLMVWNHPVCRLHPWPCHHIMQMLTGEESILHAGLGTMGFCSCWALQNNHKHDQE